jgi:hypothetical protein
LAELSGEEVVLSFSNVELEPFNDFGGQDVLVRGVGRGSMYKWWDDSRRAPHMELKAREAGRCVHGVHHVEAHPR